VVALAVAFFLSAAFVKYRDITYIWEVGLQAAFYATPILYPISLIVDQSKTAAQIIMLNPVAQVIQDARYSLVTHQTTTLYDLVPNSYLALVPFLLMVFMVALAIYYFRKNSKHFAEDV